MRARLREWRERLPRFGLDNSFHLDAFTRDMLGVEGDETVKRWRGKSGRSVDTLTALRR